MEGGVLVGENSVGSRKKKHKTKTKRQCQKEERHQIKDPDMDNFIIPCKHNNSRFVCCAINKSDLIQCKKSVYSSCNKSEQDIRLALLIKVKKPIRERPRGDRKYTAKKFVTNYYLRIRGKLVKVCAKFFSSVLNVKQTRLNRIAKFVKDNQLPKETRGGNRKKQKFAARRAAVKEFISKLKGSESHYNRKKSQRLYLPAHLSIHRLFEIYNSQASQELKVKAWFFKNIFYTKFNLGFGSPASDTCSYCELMRHKIAGTSAENEKQSLMALLGIHKKRAKTFHEILNRDVYQSATYCFDLQQVQPLPKLAIGEAYYSRQISFYCFCITDKEYKDKNFYTLTENQSGKGSVQIASALINFLDERENEFTNISKLRLFSDGCGGQNKNTHVIHALALWLWRSKSSIRSIEMYFPVRGHSFLPCDRLFGRIEKKLRRNAEIINPDEYIQFYNETGTVKQLGKDWNLHDYKELCNIFKKTDGIQDMKRVFLNKNNKGITFVMHPTYNFVDESKRPMALLKRGKKTGDIQEPSLLPLHAPIVAAKKKDIDTLLQKRFGEEWKSEDRLKFFKSVLEDESTSSVSVDEEDAMLNYCDCTEMEPESQKI